MYNKQSFRAMVRGVYDIQKLRIATGNRICAEYKHRMGQMPSEKEDTIDDKKNAKLLDKLRKDFKRLTDGLVHLPPPEKFNGEGTLIEDYALFLLMAQYISLLTTEEVHFRNLGKALKSVPIWSEYLVDVRGCGPAMAGIIVSEFDIHKAKYASSLHMYAGLDVINGEGRSRKREHLREYEYIDKEGETKTKMGLTYNPELKARLMGVLTGCLMKQNAEYKEIYDNYKHRLEHHVDHKEKTKGHRHNMAKRYMIKRFLSDLYAKWRDIEGLEVHPPYEEAKLGMQHTEKKAPAKVPKKAPKTSQKKAQAKKKAS